MAGVLFIVNVPHKEYELELRKEDNTKKTETEVSIYKCNNDLSLDINNTNGKCNGAKSTWKEIKQVVKQSKKIKISDNPSYSLQSTFHQDTPLETILSEIIFRLDIKNAAWNSSRDDKIWQVTFSLESGNQCEELIQVLRTFGIGTRHQSAVSMIPCTLYYKAQSEGVAVQDECNDLSDESAWSRFSSSVSARVNLAQILEDVRAEAALTFDWVFLLIVAAFVAALGLLENSTVILVASMLISPLMGPITAATLGTSVKDQSLQLMGLVNEMLGLFLCVVIGFIVGLAVCAIDGHYGEGEWPTYEMISRCEVRSLWVGVLVALPSGAGVALAILGGYTASLVGVAISAALLPPAINAGLFWAMSLYHSIYEFRSVNIIKSQQYSEDIATELAVFGTISLCLTLVNIICIFLAGVAVYKVKEVCPLDSRDITWWRANRRPIRASRILSRKTKQETQLSWELYKKWCNEQINNSNIANKTEIQSDTVTYRKPTPTIQRLMAQNIESYCNENNNDHHTSLNSCATNNNCEINYASFNEILEKKNVEDLTQKTDTKCNIQNPEFEDNDIYIGQDFSETNSAIIEPSINVTVDPNVNNQHVILAKNSYDV